ncbi:MAG: BtaA family protein [Actinomycetota bacterium]|nr:BtaA family protein [Actinomycetota bacterium]
MHEDWRIEAGVFPERGRFFCIASAGCTAFALAERGREVTAVDINPAQIAYVEDRLAGRPPRAGSAENKLASFRRLQRLAGWTPSAVTEFCALADVATQAVFWRERLDTRRLRAGLALILSRPALRRAYSPALVAAVPERFDRAMRRRLERCFVRHPNRDNPYARFLLLGEAEQPAPRAGLELTLACADAASYLENVPPRSFDGFALSNVLDAAPAAYRRRLLTALRRAAAPGAVAVWRTFGEATTADEAEWAARDRSFLWGGVRVEPI